KLVLACGGDGTIHEVMNGMVPGDAVLGVLPGGTTNIFARELGMPLDPLRAARVIHRWTPRRIAVGRATFKNGGQSSAHFLCLAGVGFDAHVIHELSRKMAVKFGVGAYVAEAVRQVFCYSYPAISFRANGKEIIGTYGVAQRTQRYAGWLHLAPEASLFKDQISLCVFKGSGRMRYAGYAAAIVARRHTRLNGVATMETRKVECAAVGPSTPVYLELDGEFAGQLPATFEIVPDALTVLVP
ncbi:MAG: diacylglycerol/lipid kinase family protein, partial [Deltaproteobacteria bacterium]